MAENKVVSQQVTLKHVAEVAGVSTMTVSRVFNNHPDVAEATRQRVQQIIDDLGYAPNAVARSLIRGRSDTIGVVGYGFDYYGNSRILAGIEHEATRLGYSLLLSPISHPQPTEREKEILAHLQAHQVDGILWAALQVGDERQWLVDQAQKISTPIIFFNTAHHKNTTTIAIDNYTGGQLVMQHFLDQGYRQIGIITGVMTWWGARQRYKAWREALEAASVPDLERLQVEGDWFSPSGERGLRQLLEQAPDLEAVFACNDHMALGALYAARSLGLRVPDDLAIVGFDGIPETLYYQPSLTTVAQDVYGMGEQSVQMLDAILQAGQEDDPYHQNNTVWLTPELIIRESSIRPGG